MISCDPTNVSRIREIAERHGIASDLLGETIPDVLQISLDGEAVASATISELNRVFESSLESTLRTDLELVAAG